MCKSERCAYDFEAGEPALRMDWWECGAITRSLGARLRHRWQHVKYWWWEFQNERGGETR